MFWTVWQKDVIWKCPIVAKSAHWIVKNNLHWDVLSITSYRSPALFRFWKSRSVHLKGCLSPSTIDGNSVKHIAELSIHRWGGVPQPFLLALGQNRTKTENAELPLSTSSTSCWGFQALSPEREFLIKCLIQERMRWFDPLVPQSCISTCETQVLAGTFWYCSSHSSVFVSIFGKRLGGNGKRTSSF